MEDTGDAALHQWLREGLGEDVRELIAGSHLVQDDLAILHSCMGKVLPEVDVLRTLASPDHVVCPFDTCRIVFSNRRGSAQYDA